MRTTLILMTFAAVSMVSAADIELRQGLVLPRSIAQGRLPVPDDALIGSIVDGTWKAPTAGDRLNYRERELVWREVAADKDGWFGEGLGGASYVYVPVEGEQEETRLLNAAGPGLVYVNGQLRAGDVYSYGYLTVPVRLRKGTNDFLFVASRGRFRATLKEVDAPLAIDVADPTLPDVLPGDRGPLWAGIVVRNAEAAAAQGLKIRATIGDVQLETALPSVPAMSVRKVGVRLPAPKVPGTAAVYTLSLMKGKEAIYEATVTARVRQPLQVHRRTFMSGVDGSVQYFTVNPAQKPGPTNLLVLSLHGASVESQGQADAYGPKDDVTLVAPTNRRPYGFDWEETGRVDALEVLAEGAKLPHDPARVHITGHSMGGHGTWHIGTLYPDRFATVAPSAGWVSFWSYAGGYRPEKPTRLEALLLRSMATSDTLARVVNTTAQGVYVLHGDADDNVPVDQARIMRSALERIQHPAFQYHEQPGAGHWWGNECMDWPAIFDLMRRRKLEKSPNVIDFTTPNPAVSSRAWWAEIVQQTEALTPSRIRLERRGEILVGNTTNVARLRITEGRFMSAVLDGQALNFEGRDVTLARVGQRWRVVGATPNAQKNPRRGGPFKQVFNDRLMLVLPTGGDAEEHAWAEAKARYDAETWYYRGNGSLDIVRDVDAEKAPGYRDRNVILYGNSAINRLWPKVLGDAPFDVRRGLVQVGGRRVVGSAAALFVHPKAGSETALVGVVGGTDVAGMRRSDRLGTMSPGVAYPDWFILDADGVAGTGFFDNLWRFDPAQSAWR